MKRADINGLIQYLEETGCPLSKSFIYRLVKEEKIPHIRVGSKIIFDIDRIEKWLEGTA